MKKKLDLIIAKDCEMCKRIEKELLVYTSQRSDIQLEINLNRKTQFENVSIVPALIVDGTLFSYGEVDFEKLNVKLNQFDIF
ncbi:MAG: hypothetical protein ABFS12_01710 [Bacteroidota bacterium]